MSRCSPLQLLLRCERTLALFLQRHKFTFLSSTLAASEGKQLPCRPQVSKDTHEDFHSESFEQSGQFVVATIGI